MSVADALNLRQSLIGLMANPQKGGAISGFAGAGLLDKLKEGASRLKPVAFESLANAAKSFAKGFAEKEGDLSERGVAGLQEGLKSAGKTFAEGVAKEIEKGPSKASAAAQKSFTKGRIGKMTGGSISGFTGAGELTAGVSGVKSMAKTRKLARPKI